MAGLNIVFVASEATPLAKTGGLADVVGSLPLALKKLGHKITMILPLYRQPLADACIVTKATGKAVEIWADGVRRHCPLHTAKVNGLEFILVEQDDLYDRDGLYGPPGGAYDDNLLRFVLFDRVALEAAAMGRKVDIIHCHDWQNGMIPLLLQTQYQHHAAIARAKTVFTIHNLAYQGNFPVEWIHRLGLPTHHFHHEGYEFHSQVNCMKAGIESADAVTTVSPSYAEEILTPEYGCELDGFLWQHRSKLFGIVNGLDVDHYDPLDDREIEATFGPGNTDGKKWCKAALQQECGFEISESIPLLTMVSRLADQKGIDLLLANAERWIHKGYQLAVLGSGDPDYEQHLVKLTGRHPKQMFFFHGFDEALARRIYAGSDIFLMPSRFEPCGLSQLIAMRYGAVPVVRATGGLRDTVTDYTSSKSKATGVHFVGATPKAFDAAVEKAVMLYRNPRIWPRIRNNALRRDSSWDASARAYEKLYKRLIRL